MEMGAALLPLAVEVGAMGSIPLVEAAAIPTAMWGTLASVTPPHLLEGAVDRKVPTLSAGREPARDLDKAGRHPNGPPAVVHPPLLGGAVG